MLEEERGKIMKSNKSNNNAAMISSNHDNMTTGCIAVKKSKYFADGYEILLHTDSHDVLLGLTKSDFDDMGFSTNKEEITITCKGKIKERGLIYKDLRTGVRTEKLYRCTTDKLTIKLDRSKSIFILTVSAPIGVLGCPFNYSKDRTGTWEVMSFGIAESTMYNLAGRVNAFD